MKKYIALFVLLFSVGYILSKGNINISYHKRGDGSSIYFLSMYYSNIVIEVSKKKNKGSLEWLDR